MEKKIILPEGYELVESGNEYIVRKKDTRPKSWEEFCERYPVRPEEAFIDNCSVINDDIAGGDEVDRDILDQKNLCSSKEEAEAFLALMQLRQLRKAWVGDWNTVGNDVSYIIIFVLYNRTLKVAESTAINSVMSFPSQKMAEEFLECFKDLCETAKILL